MVADGDRLRPLQVGVAGHERLRLALGQPEDDADEGLDALDRLAAGVRDVQPEGGCDLVVPRAARMDLRSDLAEPAFDQRMDVLVVGRADRLVAQLRETRAHLVELVVAQEARPVEPLGVDEGGVAVVRQELEVVPAEEAPDLRSRLTAAGAARPESHTASRFRALAAASSVSSAAIWMKPSAAWCGNVSPAP